jgi:ribonuclease P protein component
MLPAADRLRKNKLFKQCCMRGRSYGGPFFVLKVQVFPQSLALREFGFSASRKVGHAVKRNRIKRQLRAIVWGLRHRLAFGYRLVCIIKPTAAQAPYAELAAAFERQALAAGVLGPCLSEECDSSATPVDDV